MYTHTYLLVTRQRRVTTAITLHFCLKPLTPISFIPFGSTIAFCESLSPHLDCLVTALRSDSAWSCLTSASVRSFCGHSWNWFLEKCPFKTPSLTDILYRTFSGLWHEISPRKFTGSPLPLSTSRIGTATLSSTWLGWWSIRLRTAWLACARFTPARRWRIFSSLFMTYDMTDVSIGLRSQVDTLQVSMAEV